MTQWMVDSEHAMENAITYTTKLAMTKAPGKTVTFIFTSEFLLDIFVRNLADSFVENNVPEQKDLDINCIVPPKMDEDPNEEHDIGF